jgi:hypothetical protein
MEPHLPDRTREELSEFESVSGDDKRAEVRPARTEHRPVPTMRDDRPTQTQSEAR